MSLRVISLGVLIVGLSCCAGVPTRQPASQAGSDPTACASTAKKIYFMGNISGDPELRAQLQSLEGTYSLQAQAGESPSLSWGHQSLPCPPSLRSEALINSSRSLLRFSEQAIPVFEFINGGPLGITPDLASRFPADLEFNAIDTFLTENGVAMRVLEHREVPLVYQLKKHPRGFDLITVFHGHEARCRYLKR